jgi:hypothetical protein
MCTVHEMGLVIGCQLLQMILQHIAERKFQQLSAMKIKLYQTDVVMSSM